MNTIELKKFVIDRTELLKDKYTTWRTGKTRTERIREEFYAQNLNKGASYVGGPTGSLGKFKHIVEVKWGAVLEHHPMLGWCTNTEFKSNYLYPNCSLDRTCGITMMRGTYTNDKRIFEENELGGGDHVFVGTNNSNDAMMIALKYK